MTTAGECRSVVVHATTTPISHLNDDDDDDCAVPAAPSTDDMKESQRDGMVPSSESGLGHIGTCQWRGEMGISGHWLYRNLQLPSNEFLWNKLLDSFRLFHPVTQSPYCLLHQPHAGETGTVSAASVRVCDCVTVCPGAKTENTAAHKLT